jgi:RNA polymerase sigma-70 factor (ECF subfamily)
VVSLPEFRPDVQRAVEKLSVRQRAVVYLTYWEDMTNQMAANYLGISAGSVRRHLARAKTHLRRELYD